MKCKNKTLKSSTKNKESGKMQSEKETFLPTTRNIQNSKNKFSASKSKCKLASTANQQNKETKRASYS